jgi:hypothetical protein
MKKAKESGMIITKTTDITDVYNELGLSISNAIVTKYSVDKFPIDRLKSI